MKIRKECSDPKESQSELEGERERAMLVNEGVVIVFKESVLAVSELQQQQQQSGAVFHNRSRGSSFSLARSRLTSHGLTQQLQLLQLLQHRCTERAALPPFVGCFIHCQAPTYIIHSPTRLTYNRHSLGSGGGGGVSGIHTCRLP